MSYTLHTPAGNFRAFKVLIAAEYNGISVQVPDFDAAVVGSLSPTGKAPLLVTPQGGVIFESNAIARYISRLRRDTGLTGNGSIAEEAAVDSWCDFSSNELELPACIWWYPTAGYMPFQKAAYDKAKADLSRGLETLNNHLLTRTYLVNDQITLADITVASALVYPMKLVCDKDYLKPFGNVVRWFQTCVNQPEFKAVIGEVVLCKKELLAAGQEAPKVEKPKKEEKKADEKKEDKKKKKDEDEDMDEPVVVEKKADHPYKIMDRDSPSTFVMDVWKKTYSNCTSYDEAMATFWETYDANGWSLWLQKYMYNQENKRIFMTSNAVTGFQQRTDEIRKWAFGVMDVLGTEETTLEIAGLWLLRGDSAEHMIQCNDDANWYTWTKLSGKDMPVTDEVKELVKAYWTCDKELEGKPIQDSKVFK